MRTRSTGHFSEAGTVLFITLILSSILGTSLGGYLYWVRTQNVLVSESQAWHNALVIAEAGIEEGMAQINVKDGTADPLNYFSSIAANGWGAGPVYSKSNSLLGYSVIVSNDSPPTIYAKGMTTLPLVGQTITRTVKVKTSTNSLFGGAIAAIQDVTMNGNNIYVDAYDSSDTAHFTNGLYNPTYAFAGGDVATTGGILSVGNADIHGRLILAPGAMYTIDNINGLVGDMPADWPAQHGIQSSDWVITDFNKDFPDVVPPDVSGALAPTEGSGTNAYLLGSGKYYLDDNITIPNNKTLYVGGVVTLYVTGVFDAKNNSLITIAPGASLKLYVGKTTGSAVSANFGQVNNAGNAANFQFFGLPTCTSFNLNGNGAYIGTVYTPEAQLTFNGGGSTTLDFQGACVVKSASLNGHFNIHYDKNVSRIGPATGYTLASWQEL